MRPAINHGVAWKHRSRTSLRLGKNAPLTLFFVCHTLCTPVSRLPPGQRPSGVARYAHVKCPMCKSRPSDLPDYQVKYIAAEAFVFTGFSSDCGSTPLS